MAGKHRGEQSGGEHQAELQERRVRLSEQREARFQRTQSQREQRAQDQSLRDQGEQSDKDSSRSWGISPGRAVRGVTQRSGAYSGKGTLAALLLVGFVIVAIRLVADAEVADDGTTVKAKVLHPAGELGPIPILAALIATFFVLSFVAIGGGTRAKLAVILGGAVVLTLGVRSLNEIKFVGSTFGKIGTITAPTATGQLQDIYGNAGSAGSGANIAGALNPLTNPNLGTPASPTTIKGLEQDAVNALGDIIPGEPTIVGTFKNGLDNLLKGLHL